MILIIKDVFTLHKVNLVEYKMQNFYLTVFVPLLVATTAICNVFQIIVLLHNQTVLEFMVAN